MKKLLLALLFIISIKGFSQQPELLDNTWYLQNVIINGEDNFPPVNAEISEVTLDFFNAPFDFYAGMCNSLTGDLSFENSNSTFILSDVYQTLGSCNLPENNIYEVLYFSFYFDNSSQPFNYSIMASTNSSTLTVTAANGDQAIYGSNRLSVNKFVEPEIKVYPNPMHDRLTIESLEPLQNMKVVVFDIRGQKIFEKKFNLNKKEFDVSSLKPGIYFFVFETVNGRKEIRKIIKQ